MCMAYWASSSPRLPVPLQTDFHIKPLAWSPFLTSPFLDSEPICKATSHLFWESTFSGLPVPHSDYSVNKLSSVYCLREICKKSLICRWSLFRMFVIKYCSLSVFKRSWDGGTKRKWTLWSDHYLQLEAYPVEFKIIFCCYRDIISWVWICVHFCVSFFWKCSFSACDGSWMRDANCSKGGNHPLLIPPILSPPPYWDIHQ